MALSFRRDRGDTSAAAAGDRATGAAPGVVRARHRPRRPRNRARARPRERQAARVEAAPRSPLHLAVTLPRGDVAVRITTIGREESAPPRVSVTCSGLPAGSRPRFVASRLDKPLATGLNRMVRGYDGTAGYYVQSLTDGSGAAWNAKAHFPAASTLKLAIAATVLARHSRDPAARLARRRAAARADRPVRRRGRERAPGLAQPARRARARTA